MGRLLLVIRLLNKYSLITLLLTAPPALILLGLIIKYGVNVPFWDQWELVTQLQHLENNTFSFMDLWVLHNEHRILFPRIIMLTLSSFTKWNIKAELFFSFGLAVCSFFLLLVMIRETFPRNAKKAVFISIITSILFFSPMQWENWLWGWAISWFLSVLGVISTIFFLSSNYLKWTRKKRLLIAMLSATVASYSLGNGIFVWLIGAFIIVAKNWNRKLLCLWGIVGLLELAVYYGGYVNPTYHPSKLLFLQRPFDVLYYLLGYLGGSLGLGYKSGAMAGACISSAFIFSFLYLYKHKKEEISRLAPWFSLSLFAVLSAILTDVSRVGFGINQAASSRYITVSNLFLISTIIIATVCIKHITVLSILSKSILVWSIFLFAMIISLGYSIGVESIELFSNHLKALQTCVRTVKTGDEDCLRFVYTDKKVLLQRIEFLKSRGLSDIN